MKHKKLTILALLSTQFLALSNIAVKADDNFPQLGIDDRLNSSILSGNQNKNQIVDTIDSAQDDLRNQEVYTTEEFVSEGNATAPSKNLEEKENYLTIDSAKDEAKDNQNNFLSNWEYEENQEKIILIKYTGISKEISIPSRFDGKQVSLKSIDNDVLPRDIVKFSIQSSKDQVVLLESKVLDSAFIDCTNLKAVDLKGLDTSNVESMSQMFENCVQLKKVNMSDSNTKKVKSMDSMFKNCPELSEVDITNFDTSQVEEMQQMFFGCGSLSYVDLTSFSLQDKTATYQMFQSETVSELLVLTDDPKLLSMDMSESNRTPLSGPVLKTLGGAFDNQKQVKKYFEQCIYPSSKISLNEFENFKRSNRPTRNDFATEFDSWKVLNESQTKVENVMDLLGTTYEARWQDSNWDFEETESEIVLNQYKGTSSEIKIPSEIDGKQVYLSDINTTVIPKTITKITIEETNHNKVKIKDSNLNKAFHNNKVLTEVDLRGVDTSNITNMSQFFQDCSNLQTVNLSGLDVSNVTTFKNMFYECKKLTEANLSSLNSSKVNDMSYMFYNCYDLEKLSLTNVNTTSVQTMEKMFHNCFIRKNISELDLSSFYTPHLINTNRMFNGAKLPRVIRLDQFDMSKVTDSSAMFYGNNQELLVVTSSSALRNYPFSVDRKSPIQTPHFDANGGTINNQNQVVNYFKNCTASPEELKLSAFDQFKSELIPQKEGAKFRGWTSKTTSEPASVLDLLDETYYAVWKNLNCNTSLDNQKITSNGDIGFTYLPQKFEVPNVELLDFGTQVIPIKKSESLNIGIRDFSQRKSNWNLSGKLIWGDEAIPGAYVQLDAAEKNITKNINNNITDFNSDKDLIDANGEVVLSNESNSKLHLTANESIKIIEANQEKIHDDIYDYNLGEVSLVIPSAEQVKAGEFQAKVEWHLSNTPQ
ncbi:BspA family leucine-rich repeat surface protein [Enterococcus casseliflavus]|uniref:BspA family leucine-rich repeat surface protein n=1 Tax=Enterococcus casseliflavus TaxID=37734 RepID=UPI001AD69E36|nr:BspA family leucine-rich repeat surface protein [Enterococcus casseliflavus]MBO6359194.1 BspA family leucine-rich repeat surface protein [Enterococcus casseliflavus]MBO6376843.1 BspA family leucine-rich repeat surface protein [Enterococcus casseliflavus]